MFKWVLWFVGALLVGALGNGFWESLLRPALHSITRWILDIASLGLTSYKDGVYEQIATDNQSAVALQTLSWATAVSTLLFGALVGFLTGRAAAARSELRQDVEAELKSERIRRLIGYVSLLSIAVLLATHVVSVARLSYANSADSHYHHVLRVVAPYLEAHEQAEIESDFAQIGSREDYVRLLSRLEGQCKAHGRTVPKFDPW